MIKWDGHTHTKFCKHGSPAETGEYIERAAAQGFQRYTLSEHPPLPDRWVKNEQLMAELAMNREELPAYLRYAQDMKAKYADSIEVTVGLEMDYLDGYESFSDRLLDSCGDVLEDVVVSVHYLAGVEGMRCLDFTPEDFREGILAFYGGSMDAVVDAYYDQVELAVAWAAKLPYRKRLGHINLIEKFSSALPPVDPAQSERRLRAILPKLAEAGLSVDVNTAGLRVSTCGRSYVPEWFVRECVKRGIPCVYGSDAHRPDHVGYGWDWYEKTIKSASEGWD